MSRPSYMSLYKSGELHKRAQKLLSLTSPCRLCPRKCRVNRLEGETGFCGLGKGAKVASYNAHFGEEDPLVGRYGSGTIFLSGCNLKCSFCQNYEISHETEGTTLSPEQMAGLMLELQKRGCHNINFVTPSHVVPQIAEALIPAAAQGLNLPLVYNSSGYDGLETLTLLDGIFDIYMPDFKFWDDQWSRRYCYDALYREAAIQAVKEMHRQVGDLETDKNGLAVKGLLVRHLVMPNLVSGTGSVMKFLANRISKATYVNVMDQYRPCGTASHDPFINRPITAKEYKYAVNAAHKAGLTRLDPRVGPRLLFQL